MTTVELPEITESAFNEILTQEEFKAAVIREVGVSDRVFLAGMALQGIIAGEFAFSAPRDSAYPDISRTDVFNQAKTADGDTAPDRIVRWARKYADLMLQELKKTGG